MTRTRLVYGIAIEGVGVDSVTGGLPVTGSTGTPSGNGAVLYYGRHTPTVSSWDWVQALRTLPRTTSTSIRPELSEITGSPMSFELSASDLITGLVTRTGTQAVATLVGDISASATSLTLTRADLSFTVVYIGDEAIYLGDSLTTTTYPVTRARWSTSASAHSAGANVYDAIPQWRDRPVRLLEHEVGTITARTIWIGLISGITMPTPEVIRISCVEYFSRWFRLESNRTPRDLAANGGATQYGTDAIYVDDPSDVSSARSEPVSGIQHLAVQVGGGVAEAPRIPGLTQVRAYTSRNSTSEVFRLGTQLRLGELDSPVPGTVRGPYSQPVWELFVVDQLGDKDQPTNKISSTQQLSKPYHNIAIALALITSDGTYTPADYKVLAANIGLGIPYVDVKAEWDPEITATPELNEVVEQLVRGWDGQPFSTFRLIQDLLRLSGHFVSRNEEADLTVRRFEMLSIDMVGQGLGNTLDPYIERWEYDQGVEGGTTRLFADVGGTPWKEPSRIEVGIVGESPRASRFDTSRLNFNLEFVRRTRAEEVSVAASNAAVIQSLQLPTVGVRVGPSWVTGIDYDLGSYVSFGTVPLRSGWWADSSGARIMASDMEGEELFIGMIVGVRFDLQTGARDLELKLIAARGGGYARLRGPAMHLDNTSSGTTLVGPLIGETDFGSSSDDAGHFDAGDEAQLFYLDGAPVSSEVRVVTATGDNGTRQTVTISSAFTATPDDTMVLRLARSEDFSNTSRYSFTDRPFVFFADASGEIVDSSSATVDGDPFGGGSGFV